MFSTNQQAGTQISQLELGGRLHKKGQVVGSYNLFISLRLLVKRSRLGRGSYIKPGLIKQKCINRIKFLYR